MMSETGLTRPAGNPAAVDPSEGRVSQGDRKYSNGATPPELLVGPAGPVYPPSGPAPLGAQPRPPPRGASHLSHQLPGPGSSPHLDPRTHAALPVHGATGQQHHSTGPMDPRLPQPATATHMIRALPNSTHGLEWTAGNAPMHDQAGGTQREHTGQLQQWTGQAANLGTQQNWTGQAANLGTQQNWSGPTAVMQFPHVSDPNVSPPRTGQKMDLELVLFITSYMVPYKYLLF